MDARRCAAAALGVSMVWLVPLTSIQAGDDPRSDELARPPERVLFVGNSHTAFNGGLDWLIESMVAAEPVARPFDGELYTHGGVTLEYHVNNGAPKRIRTGGFDTVVLQGYLPRSSTGTIEPFIENARLLDEIIRESGARTVLFMTWPQGVNDWSTLTDVVEAHRIVAAELGAPVAPAALAFERARAERPELALIGPDRIHATWAGEFLAAMTVYATLFERDPQVLDFSFGLSEEDAAFLRRIAWESVIDWRASSPASA